MKVDLFNNVYIRENGQNNTTGNYKKLETSHYQNRGITPKRCWGRAALKIHSKGTERQTMNKETRCTPPKGKGTQQKEKRKSNQTSVFSQPSNDVIQHPSLSKDQQARLPPTPRAARRWLWQDQGWDSGLPSLLSHPLPAGDRRGGAEGCPGQHRLNPAGPGTRAPQILPSKEGSSRPCWLSKQKQCPSWESLSCPRSTKPVAPIQFNLNSID